MRLSLSEVVFLPKAAISTGVAGLHEPDATIPTDGSVQNTRRYQDHLRRLIGRFDGIIRRLQGVHEFSTRADCLLRIAIAWTTADARLADGSHVHQGTQIIDLHLWNEHLAGLALQSGSLGGATRLRTQIRVSLGELARYIEADPSLREIGAVRAHTALVRGRRVRKLLHVALAFGFSPALAERAEPRPLELYQLWQNLFVCALAWTFNPAALRRNGLLRQHCELWMSRQALIAGYGRNAANLRRIAAASKTAVSTEDQSSSFLLRVPEIQHAGSGAVEHCAAAESRQASDGTLSTTEEEVRL